jgi:hypothetical protein
MVAVSHNAEFVFLRPGKSASTSVEIALEPFCTGSTDRVIARRHAQSNAHGIIGTRGVVPETALDHLWEPHMPAFRVQAALGRETFARYTKLITIRNPFDRMVSNYLWHSRDQNHDTSAMDAHTLIDGFDRFLDHVKWINDEQMAFIGGRYIVDTVIRFEHLEADLRAFLDAKGLDPTLAVLPVTKKTSQNRQGLRLAEFYDARRADIVRAAFEWVFERYDYASDPEAADQIAPAMPQTASAVQSEGCAS